MRMPPQQPALLEMPEQPVKPQKRKVTAKLKLKSPDRQQIRVVPIDVEELIPANHKARAIWELAGRWTSAS